MTYYPYFRGKQYELITIRETANLMAENGFVPIIEPVKEQLRALHKALDTLCESNTNAIVIVNPQHGFYKSENQPILNFLQEEFSDHSNLIMGLRLDNEVLASEVIDICKSLPNEKIAFIHAGFKEANALVSQSANLKNVDMSVFLDAECGKLYQKKFGEHSTRVLVRDGFERRRNRDHPTSEFFSDLHLTFGEENVTAYGDYLIVGDDYSEGGGAAYTIAIHLTYIDPDQDDTMFIRHFLSDRKDTAEDPGGKFAEALSHLIDYLDQPNCKIYETSAVKEFRDLHARSHYPGLGVVKKLGMKHHIETLAIYSQR